MAQDNHTSSTEAAIEKLSGKLDASMEQILKEQEVLLKQKTSSDEIDMQNRFFSGLSRMEILGVPVGSALGGGTVALLTSEMLEAALPDNSSNITRGFLKLFCGGAMVQFISGLAGK